MPARQLADRRALLVGEPGRDELAQPSSGPDLEDAERAVPGTDQVHGGMDDALQRTLQRQVRVDADDRVEQALQPVLGVEHVARPG